MGCVGFSLSQFERHQSYQSVPLGGPSMSSLEIECGKASLLEKLCRQARARGLGIDPTFEPGRVPRDVDLTALREFFEWNPIYVPEITAMLHGLGLQPGMRALGAPAMARAGRAG